MLVVTVLYPGSGGETFDYDYYLSKHMPLVHERWDSMGLKGTQVLRGQAGPDGGKPQFSTITLLNFESAAAFKAAADAHGAELFGDIPNFTNGKPTLQLNETA